MFELVAAQGNNKIPPILKDPKFAVSTWRTATEIMEKYNEPGRFTALIAYECTSNSTTATTCTAM
jgi:hypothetical protein